MFSSSLSLAAVVVPLSCGQMWLFSLQDVRLEMHLLRWQEAARKIKDFRCEWERTEIDNVFRLPDKVTYLTISGTGSHLLRLEFRDSRRELGGVFFFRDGQMHIYDFHSKTESFLPWPPKDPPAWGVGWLNDMFVGAFESLVDLSQVLAGIPVSDGRGRFNVSLAGEDAHYVYLRFRPCSKGTFNQGCLALDKKEYATRAMWIQSLNGDETRYILKQRQTNLSPPLTSELLVDDLPKGWPPIGSTRKAK
jgi:hypothetical protein